jgi:hypothetical protein
MQLVNKRFIIIACACAAVASCSLVTAPATTSYGSGGRRILFIGNSLTAANNMPAMLAALAESAKVSPLPSIDVDWLPDYALIDHRSMGRVQGIITNGHCDVVVLQQRPSSRRTQSRHTAAGRRTFRSDHQIQRRCVLPGGEVWRAAWNRNATLQLYSDGLPAHIRLRDGSDGSVDIATARLLQESADEANRLYGLKPVP